MSESDTISQILKTIDILEGLETLLDKAPSSKIEEILQEIAMSVGHLAEFLTVSLETLQIQWIYWLNIQDIAPQLYRANNGYLFREVLRSHPDRDRIIENALKSQILENMQKLEKANSFPEYLLSALTGQLPQPHPINIPTLGIWSEKDDFLWESQMKNSGKYILSYWEYIRIEQAGHWFMLEQPDKTNQLLLDWLTKDW